MTSTSLWSAAACVAIALTFAPVNAEAAITSVTVNTTRQYENARGYTYAEVTVQGSVTRADGSVGLYSVPAVVIYPRHHRGNRVGIVDWINCAYYHFFPAITEFGTFQFTLLATGHDLFEHGYTYVSIQWDKAVTEIFGPAAPLDGRPHNHLVYGSIDRSADAWEILLDAARLLKDPRAYPGDDGPSPVATVLSSGYSQGAGAQLELLAEGLDPARVYDGHLVQMIGLTCWKREDVAPHFGFFGDCRPLPANGDHAPVIVLASESDMLIFDRAVLGFGKSAFFTRNPTDPNWRQYEMAGISHLPEPILPLGVPDQNSADARPIFRAAFDNLTKWAQWRVRPPDPQFFRGRVDVTGIFIPETDGDGHFTGGVRLPHVDSIVHGHAAGAPLGRYTPLNPLGLDPFNPFVFIGGTFTRFTDDALLARYRSRGRYVRRVARAADRLARQGYITNADRNTLIQSAQREPLPFNR